MIKKIFSIVSFIFILSCTEKPEAKEILFVCTHGAARSPIATAYFNKLAKEQNLNYYATFKGTEPDSVLTKETVNGLRKDDFEISDWKPELVSENHINKADRIITFDLELLNTAKKVEQWNGTPSISKDYEKARDVIKEKVMKLIDSLSKK